ncbi:MAG: AAA family ATPase, partial [Candidatus Solibacter sp.]|nr:AAA family ATPase [Candidatus Solibacter sp.]
HRYPRPTLQSTPRDVDRKIKGQDGFASPFLYDFFIRYNMPVYPGAPWETPLTSVGESRQSMLTVCRLVEVPPLLKLPPNGHLGSVPLMPLSEQYCGLPEIRGGIVSEATGYNRDVELNCNQAAGCCPMLIIFGGLPGVGKTAIATELARLTGALHLRIDSIEQAIRASGLGNHPLDDAGYRVAYAVAEDNLRIGRTVIADSVNPLQLTREAWVAVANRVRVRAMEIEVKCSDAGEHRRRVETRTSDIAGLELPTWKEVVGREYHPWDREHLVIDTAGQTVEQSVAAIREALAKR